MPANTNGVYQDKSIPGYSNRGAGAGVSLKTGSPGMGKSQYGGAPVTKHSGSPSRGHDNKNNSSYK